VTTAKSTGALADIGVLSGGPQLADSGANQHEREAEAPGDACQADSNCADCCRAEGKKEDFAARVLAAKQARPHVEGWHPRTNGMLTAHKFSRSERQV
jgi:hypothetical protein